MEIILLGEKFSIPHYSRSIASVAVRFDNYNELCLFECGEGTQNYLLHSCLKNKQIKRVIISELNSNCCLGMVGLLATFSLNERISSLEVHGPEGFCKYLRLFSRYSQTNFSYPIKIFPVKTGTICQFSDYQIIATSLKSFPDIFGYSIIEQEKPGKFQISKAQSLKIPSGPIYGHLKKKEKFILSNGFVINGQNLCDKPRQGRKFTYLTRVNYNRSMVELAWKADILLINPNIAHLNPQTYLEYQVISSQMGRQIFEESEIRYLINFNFKENTERINSMIYFFQWYQNKIKQSSCKLTYPFVFKITSNYLIEL